MGVNGRGPAWAQAAKRQARNKSSLALFAATFLALVVWGCSNQRVWTSRPPDSWTAAYVSKVESCLSTEQQQQQQQSNGGSGLLTPPVSQLIQLWERSGSSGEEPLDVGKLTFAGVCRTCSAPVVPELTVRRIWLSTKPRNATDVSLVTQLSVDRLRMLEGQCSNWGSVISAAVHIPLMKGRVVSEVDDLYGQDVEKPLEMISEFHDRMEREGRCTLDIVFATSTVTSVAEADLYPVNAMRNKALQLSQTEIVLLLDADLLPSRPLSDFITKPAHYHQLRRDTARRQVYVLPAFATKHYGHEARDNAFAASRSRHVLKNMYKRGQLRGFHVHHFFVGQGIVDFPRWFKTNDSYPIAYQEGFEPYVLMQRRFVPWYDERFKGYNRNKVVHFLHMHSLGLEFNSCPHGYAVHVPHPEGKTRSATVLTGTWDELLRMYDDSREEMVACTFVPATSFACESSEPELLPQD
ncbi:Glycosyltransferase LARGE2 [Micractinium conductrix]|uniref:Glycosyltransferase LARGE2 n=1 Tax=Micractinium conductrix TaxID=554055 RepID=A0A2P6V7H0_9CHLO|nr:Glycosyltransferase LARGE2 [Micractinium conductrix]PSC70079.1 Glycosyltransferase LARGE2 [Micractinium conductrix]|eukprot:PSC70030.1 Glycosyltransferase LARGE2 [Micractinium conductrix]